MALDSFLGDCGSKAIALLKVDVEGYETLVFRGASRLIESRKAALIYYEVCPELTRRAGFDPEGPSRLLTQNGYRLHRLNEKGKLVPADVAQVVDVVLENWIAVGV